MNEQFTTLNLKCEAKVPYPSWIYTPKNFDVTSSEKYPLMIFLHGAGERGHDQELARKHGPGKLIKAGREFPFIIVAPQCPPDTCWWAHHIEALLDDIIARYPIDLDRIYITGLSMGGHGTWMSGAYLANRLAAIAPICGWGNFVISKTYGTLPIWAFHGEDDDVVPCYYSENLVKLITEVGGNAKLTVFPGVGHYSWEEVYAGTELYEWLLSHKLSDRA